VVGVPLVDVPGAPLFETVADGETIRVVGSAILSMTASGSSSAYRYCTIDPMIRGSQLPSGAFSTRV